MQYLHLGNFLFLSALSFGAIQLLFWLRDRKTESPQSQQRWDWWNKEEWRKRDWTVLGFFLGYGCAILLYWISGMLTGPVADVTSYVVQALTDMAAR